MLRKYFLLFLTALSALCANAQAPVAQFDASTTSGCAALAVAFKDLSTGAPKFWNWDFGNGQLSNLQNPVAVYTLPGTYTVKLVVRNNDGVSSSVKTNYITVNPSPSANFSSNLTIACSPAVIQFNDLSTSTAGSIVSWDWDFGDGTSSTQKSPAHTYTTNGFYAVTLKVVSSTGCTNTMVRARYIRIISGVKPQFTYNSTGNCNAPYIINFVNQTTGPGTITYNWNLGNATTSTQTNPIGTYNSTGNYVVKLLATSSLGCSDTVQNTITLSTASTKFNVSDSACSNKLLVFQNQSTPLPTTTAWSYGDGKTSTLINGANIYNTPGNYTVKMVNNYGFCKDSVSKTLKIMVPPIADFAVDKRYGCKGPFTVNFTDISPNAMAWRWDFGDGGSSTQKNPSYTYVNDGEYDVKLTITNNNGCDNTVIKQKFIVITKPKAIITGTPASGCVPFSFSPTSASTSVDGISTYFWDFGNGNTSTLANPTTVYNTLGNFDIKLKITTITGCTDSTTVVKGVKVGTIPVVNFTSNINSTCASTPVNFTDLSPQADQWLWDFGDGTTSTLQNPSHLFEDTGKLNIKLTVWNNGCNSSITKTQFINITPPVAKFTYTLDCNNRYTISFVNQSKASTNYGPINYFWEFGDPGNNTSTSANPSFTYPALGSYAIKLTVSNGACTHTIIRPISLAIENADFSASKTDVCKKEVFTLSAINSNAANVAKYEWQINGGTKFLKSRSFDTSFANSGNYTITLSVTDLNGCVVTKTVNAFIKVNGPTASFGSVTPGGCKNGVITFTDNSTTTNIGLVKWDFDFGDNKNASFSLAPFTHTYADTGVYTVKLKVTDDKSCTDTITKPALIKITNPSVNFSALDTLFCQGGALQFYDSSIAFNPTYVWTFGDGGTSNLKDPTHIYTGADGKYTVTLKLTDQFGCQDSITKVNYVRLLKPKPAFDAIDTAAICPPLETKFIFKGKDYESYYWDFGDGSASTLKNPNYFYNNYGSYNAKLYLVGYGGCLDSAVKTINLYNPYDTKINFSPNAACNELLVNFNVVTPPGTRFIFYYGDGAVDSTNAKIFSHFYASPNLYSPFLILIDSLDCRVAVGASSQINILGALPFFGMDTKKFCDTGRVFFTNFALGNDTVVSQIWNFGDGNTATTKDAIHFYSQPGTYIPSLTVTTKSGCSKTLDDTVRVYSTPHPIISGPDEICLLSTVNFSGSLVVPDTAAIKWSWSFGNGLTDSVANPGPIRYNIPGDYPITLKAVHPFGCQDSAAKKILRVNSLPVITMPAEQTVLLGTSVTIAATYSSGVVNYNWTPFKSLSCNNCPNPDASPALTTKYNVNVTDSNSCESNKDVVIKVICNENNFFIPNTFSPNNDGSNDVFYPRGNRLYDVQSMRIFNRWGQKIFEKKNFPANQESYGWDGMVNGKMAESDTYVFLIEVICENAQIIPIKGNVTLIR